MALRRKQEEKNLQLLRELAAQQHNKQCLDCGQRGPTYVNMTIGSFVCTSCSGRLRGLTPPHRVKSISMASFSAEEIEFIKQRGNEWCKAVWLGLLDPSRHPEADSKEDQQIKDFMAVKYEKKRYYVDPSVAFKDGPTGGQHSPPAASTAPAAEIVPPVRPLSKLAGGPVKPIVLNQNKAASGAAPSRPAEKKNIDLLADLSPVTSSAQADPFSPTGGSGSGGGGGGIRAPPATANFANFANFDSLNASAPQTGGRLPAGAVPTPFANFSSPAAALSAVPLSTAAATPRSAPAPAPAPAPAAAGAGAGGDRYAALKELDEVLKAEVDPKLDWATAAAREPAPASQGWAAFGSAPAMTPNGPAPYGQSPQTSSYGQSPQTGAYGQSPQQHGLTGFPQAQYAPAGANGFTPGSPWPQPVCPPASFSPYSPAGYGGYRQPYMSPYGAPVSEMGLSGYGATNGSSGMLPGGQWAAQGPQAAGWGPPAPAPPAANPFMSCNGSTPVNPHNPFL